jgi:hypothetical protein
VSGALLALLVHPDSRARIDGSSSGMPAPGRSVAAFEDRYR